MADGKTTIVTGASRSGKTYFVTREMMKRRRVVLYDPKAHPKEWPEFITTRKSKTLGQLIFAQENKPFKIRVGDSSLKEFDEFCYWVTKFARTRHGVGLVVIVDELAAVTGPAKAPKPWGDMVRTLKGFGVDLYAITQRPAESDKTCFGNADRFVSFYMTRKNDRKNMASEMNIEQSIIDNLPVQLKAVVTKPGEKGYKFVALPKK